MHEEGLQAKVYCYHCRLLRPHLLAQAGTQWVRTCIHCGTSVTLQRNRGRPTKQEAALMEAWEHAVALLDMLLDEARDDYDQRKPVGRSLIGHVELALKTLRGQRSALFRQGRLFEGEDD